MKLLVGEKAPEARTMLALASVSPFNLNDIDKH